MSSVYQDSRLKKDSGQSRENRKLKEHAVISNRQMTDKERLDMFRSSFFQNQLPDLPPIPGYHTVWLTTTNSQDPIHARIRLGYELIQAADLPGWDHCQVKEGMTFAGCIMVNEMIAAKLPLDLYQEYMKYTHHERPLEEEQGIKAQIDQARDALPKGVKLTEGDGTRELGKDPGAPDFGRLQGDSGEPYEPFELEKGRGIVGGSGE